MSGQLRLTREELALGFASGRGLIQEEWAHPKEIAWVDELIAEGKAAVTTPWSYSDDFQCERRTVKGVTA